MQAQQREKQRPQIPLANLFAYIRDLYHTAPPEVRFDKRVGAKDQHQNRWYPLGDLLHIAKKTQALGLCSWQHSRTDLPLLQLQRAEASDHPPLPACLKGWLHLSSQPGQAPTLTTVSGRKVPFDEQAHRVAAFEAFQQTVAGKALDQVQDLTIPPELTLWLELEEADGKVVVNHKAEAYEAFEGSAERVSALANYQADIQDFHKGEGAYLRLNQWYDTLHHWWYELKAQPDLQLTLSFGLFSGGKGKQHYRNYLFHVPLELQLKRQTLSLSLAKEESAVRAEQHFTELIPSWFPEDHEQLHDQRLMDVVRRIDQFNALGHAFSLDPTELRETFYYPALEMLDIFPQLVDRFWDGQALPYDWQEPQEGVFSFSFSPVIQLREPGNQIHIARDASQIIKQIQALSANGKHQLVPAFFQKLFSLRQKQSGLRIAFRQQDRAKETLATSTPVAEPFYFPLPYNEAQLAIAKRLSKTDAATVQGPPGTGKSHSIANLAAHFAAMGKSILIVSKYAKALEVIREKLPPSLQELAITFSNNEQHREQLKHAIDAVKNHLAHPIDPAMVVDEEVALKVLYDEKRELEADILALMAQQQQTIALYNPYSGKQETQSIAAWAYQYEEVVGQVPVISDAIPATASIQSWVGPLSEGLSQAKSVDFSLMQQFWPAPETLPSPETLETWKAELEQLIPAGNIFDASQLPEEAFQQQHIATWETLSRQLPVLLRHQAMLQHPHFNLGELLHLLRKVKPIFEQHQRCQQHLMNAEIRWGKISGQPLETRLATLARLIEKFPDTGPLPRLKRTTLGQAEKAILTATINGNAIAQKADLVLLKQSAQQEEREAQLHQWATTYLAGLDQTLGDAFPVATWVQWSALAEAWRQWQAWRSLWLSWGIVLPEPWEDEETVSEMGETLAQWRQVRHKRQQVQVWATRIPQGEGPMAELKTALLAENIEGYRAAFERYIGLSKQAMEARELGLELAEWEGRLPQLLAQVYAQSAPDFASAEELCLSLHAAQIRTLLEDQVGPDLQHLTKALAQKQAEIQAKTTDLVRLKTWSHKQTTLTDEQKSALSAWRNDLINLGKGFGKNSAQHLKSAIQNLKLAREVVPIWIMSQEAAIRFFPEPTPGQFDLLIIDEASQVDISALNLIFRAKKVLIVGDENQTSVHTQAALFPIERTNQILDRYLGEHPFKQQFHLNNRTASIYSLSGVIYPHIISLKEHFRCRPEIISFSNEYVYNQHIVPLRTPGQGIWGAPAEVHQVEDVAKEKKRPNLTAQAIHMLESIVEAYEQGHLQQLPTVGLLCLDSSNEVHLTHLESRLNKSPLLSRYRKEMRLLVGTSRAFQGDERDLMILTSTAIHTTTKAGKIRPPRAVLGEEMMRIYNVAVSRAKEKVILLHGIHPDAVAMMQPHCYRARLIRHLGQLQADYARTEGKPFRHQPKLIPSSFIAQVQAKLAEHVPDMASFPHFPVGGTNIDLATWYQGKAVAIFCDEAADHPTEIADRWEQQTVLSRTGWHCYRIQIKDWALDPVASLQRLLRWLETS